MVELFSQLLKALLFHWETLISEFHPSFCSSRHIECKLEGAPVMHGWVICLLFGHKLWAVSISSSSTFIAWLYSTVLQVMKQVWCFQLLVETFFLYVLQCTLQNMEGTKEVDEVCSFFFYYYFYFLQNCHRRLMWTFSCQLVAMFYCNANDCIRIRNYRI